MIGEFRSGSWELIKNRNKKKETSNNYQHLQVQVPNGSVPKGVSLHLSYSFSLNGTPLKEGPGMGR